VLGETATTTIIAVMRHHDVLKIGIVKSPFIMPPTFARGSKTAISKLLELRRQAQKDEEPRVVLRIQGILMSLEGHTTGEISNSLKVHRSSVPLWIEHWNRYGPEGLWEGHRSGRPSALSSREREKLCDILDSGPRGIWFGNRDLD
jgi:Winged helix-turn helix